MTAGAERYGFDRLQGTGTGSLRTSPRRMAGCATPTSSVGHAPAGVSSATKLTLNPDHLVGAGQIVDPLPPSFQTPSSGTVAPPASPLAEPAGIVTTASRPSLDYPPLGWPGHCPDCFQRDRKPGYGLWRWGLNSVRRREPAARRLLAVHRAQHGRLYRGANQCTACGGRPPSQSSRRRRLEPPPAREPAKQPAA
jgi:hypothetical protein